MSLKNGILLDVGCRNRKEHNFTGLDFHPHPGVDIVHNLEKFPYPLKTASCLTIKAAHVIEHIKPWLVFSWMDEMWRLLLPNGQLAISAPYAGSAGYWQDPTHVTAINESTFQHFDPDFPLYSQYEPKPWKIEFTSWKPGGNIEAILRKRDGMDDLAIRLATKAISLKAIQKSSELISLINFLKGKRLNNMVEIGTAQGGVFYVLCQLAHPKAKIISIDLPRGPFGGGYKKSDIPRFKSYGQENQKLYFLMLDSHKENTKQNLNEILNGSKIDFLLFDGDHSYEGIKKDWMMYSPMVKKGGIIVFHDICHHTKVPSCKVDQFWMEIKDKYKTIEFIDDCDKTWGGIGVLIKK